ncbi:MAG: AAA family ATPase [Gammaproteobacteria bacterium]|nr:AAA family ATPase [Gammaproteobacteria bacterium]
MLTRLKINGFKNLVDVDIRFGPFTCIAGANGVGKSNLFDAIRFLSALADSSFLEAAHVVRDDDEDSRSVDIRSLFHRVGELQLGPMSFEAEMIIPSEGQDNLGQTAKATTTFLRYKLELAYVADGAISTRGTLKLEHESLDYYKKGDAHQHLLFQHSAKSWRESLGFGKRTSPFISTDNPEGRKVIKIHQDRQDVKGGGRTRKLLADSLPRTALSDTNASESPTALLARLEMRSWRLLQLEPTALRRPDEFNAPSRLGVDGAHLAKSLYTVANSNQAQNGIGLMTSSNQVYAQVTNRLSQLLDDVRTVRVDRDEKRELLTLEVAGKDGTFHPARSLSDGTLRFLALAVLELERSPGVLSFEEPENGIHPQRISAMLELLQDIAVDTDSPIGDENPLRQVIINTHSPGVVAHVPADSLLVADLQEGRSRFDKTRFRYTRFSCLPNTWRAKGSPPAQIMALGRLLSYLNPAADDLTETKGTTKYPQVKDHFREQVEMDFK